MHLTANKRTALYLMRQQRAVQGKNGLPRKRIGLIDPNPFPGSHWTKMRLDPSTWDLNVPHGALESTDICVRSASARPKSRFANCTLYDASIPSNSFIRLNSSIAISCPELLFAELAPIMDPCHHLQLGLELCGRFSRSPDNPFDDDAVMNIPAATSVQQIERYLGDNRHVAGTKAARRTLALLSDNAWSPMEAVIATMMALPLEENGYGFGRCWLNPRYHAPRQVRASAHKESRVPDIMVAGTAVGINYDGTGHLDLKKIARAGISLGQEPGSAHRERELDSALRAVREKALDDIRRDRELSADGLTIFTVSREDLYEYGGLDRVMMQLMTVLELREGWDMSDRMALLQSHFARRERQRAIYSMIPGRRQVPASDIEEVIIRWPGFRSNRNS